MDEHKQPGTIEMRLMALGAALVGKHEQAAHIIADALEHIDSLHREIAAYRRLESGRRDAKARARRPR